EIRCASPVNINNRSRPYLCAWTRRTANTQRWSQNNLLFRECGSISETLKKPESNSTTNLINGLGNRSERDWTERSPGHLVKTDNGNIVRNAQVPVVESFERPHRHQ